MRDDVVTCSLSDRVGDVQRRIEASPYGFALVVAARGTLLGRLRKSACVDLEATVERLMEPGPSTVRPDTDLSQLVKRLRDRGFRTAVVSDPDGKLLGVVPRADAEKRLS
jgi:CBS-domain-containing membrane protein